MPTRAAEPTHAPTRGATQQSPGVGTAAKQVAEHASTLARLGLELARLEAKNKAAALGLGIGAALVALYALGFLFATIALALAIVLDAWLALLLVTVGLLTVATVLGLLAKAKLTGSSTSKENNGHS